MKKNAKKSYFQGIQSVNDLKKADGTTLTLTTQENPIKKTLHKRLAIPLDFDFFKYLVYPYGLKEDLIVRIELNSAKHVILCTEDTNAIYEISDIFLEYDAIFDNPYITSIGEMDAGGMLIPYTKVTSIHYDSVKKYTLSGRLT